MNNLLEEDIEEILSDDNIMWDKLRGKTVLVTGATGLIGKLIVKSLLKLRDRKNISCGVIAAVRNEGKARLIFEKEIREYGQPALVVSDIKEIEEIEGQLGFIIHAASETSSRAFVERPVEVTETAIKGTDNLLRIGKNKSVEGMLFLSTMEVYGTPQDDRKITEEQVLPVVTSVVRNSYPIGKIAAESLCVSYASEYRLPVDIIRLTQTFGAGVEYSDMRVFAEFARCAIEGHDIVLKTKGETKRSYLYTSDAVRAIFTVLLRNREGAEKHKCEIYNAANENTYCSIAEMAKLVAEISGEKAIQVRHEIAEDVGKMGYAPTLCMNLDAGKLQKLGWTPKIDLAEMYQRLCNGMREMKDA